MSTPNDTTSTSTSTTTEPETTTTTTTTEDAAAGTDEKKMSKQQLKKQAKLAEIQKKKEEKLAKLQAANEEKLNENKKRLENAKNIVLTEDKTLPEATLIEIKSVKNYINQRVKIYGWVHTLRNQGSLMFIELRDGTGVPALLQCVLSGTCTQTYDALTLAREASIFIYGTLKADERAIGGVELQGDYWEIVGRSNGEIENKINRDSNPDVLADQRHFVLRQLNSNYIFRLRSLCLQAFRNFFFNDDFCEVTPPTLVQTQVEGGSTLFELNYFGEKAYLTQSSQLYLETAVFSVKKAFCILPSFRAEKSRTRRHLAEFTHLEGEMAFLKFEDLLDTLERMVVDVAKTMSEKGGDMLRQLNPDFKVPETPFLRMTYHEAIDYCNAHEIYKNEKNEKFEYGDDISELPERKMTDQIGRPIFLINFPAHMKSFYMQRCGPNNELTESVDLLMPGVGEIIGGSMRTWDLEALREGYAREGLDAAPYYWYNDLREFGSVPHGGFGLGVERYLCWMLGQDHIRNVTLYPRHIGRCKP